MVDGRKQGWMNKKPAVPYGWAFFFLLTACFYRVLVR
jgi:hypothetical protein